MNRLASWLHGAAAVALVPAIVVLVTADVVARYAFSAPLPWGQEITGYLLLLSFLAAIPECTARDKHLRVELLYVRLPHFGRRLVHFLAGVSGAMVCGLIAWQAVRDVPEKMRFEEAGPISGLPVWPLSAAIALCAALGLWQLGRRALASLRRLPAWDDAEPSEP